MTSTAAICLNGIELLSCGSAVCLRSASLCQPYGRIHFFFFFFNNYIFNDSSRDELKRMKTGAEQGELVTLLDEPNQAFMFN
jgi:hypothetical protein